MPSDQSTNITQRVRTGDAVTQMTRVFLAGAISLGAIASAMGFFVMPQLIDEPTSSTVTKGAPLVVSDIVGVASSPQINDERPQYKPLQFFGGSTEMYRLLHPGGDDGDAGRDYVDLGITSRNQALSFRVYSGSVSRANPLSFFIREAHAQVSSFSIEPLPDSPYMNSQMLRLRYRQVGSATTKTINVCVGLTTASTIYVGTDGSTYTDKNLTRRTTASRCADIQSRALKVGDVSNMMFAQDENVQLNPTNEFFVHRAGFIGRMPQVGDYVENGEPRTGFNDPVAIAYRGTAPSGNDADPFQIPDTVVVISDYSNLINDLDPTLYALCFPAKNFPTGNIGQQYFFDTDGRAYQDMMLSRPASNVNCAALQQKAFRHSAISHVSIKDTPMGEFVAADGWHIKNGRNVTTTIHPDNSYQEGGNYAGGMWPTAVVPFTATPRTGTVVAPAAFIHATGDWLDPVVYNGAFSKTLCVPPATVDYSTTPATGPKVYYFDNGGNAYFDLFLTRPVAGTICNQAITGGYAPASIQTATTSTVLPDHYESLLISGSYRYGTVNGAEYSPWGYGFFEGLPLAVMLGNGDGYPVDLQVQAVRVTDGSGATKTLCWGPFTQVTEYPRTTVRYYNAAGQSFSDIFLTRPVSCTLPSSGGGGGGPIRVPIEVE